MGRPKGSKNKIKSSTAVATVVKRGRPKKVAKIQEALEAVQPVETQVKGEKPTEQIAVLPAIREFILQNFGKMSNDELAMKCNLSVRQVEDIATDINQHFPDLKNEDKPQRLNNGMLKFGGAIQATEASGRISDAFIKKTNPSPKVEGLSPVRAE